MGVKDWLAIESLKSEINNSFSDIDLKLKSPTVDYSSQFTLEGYRTNIKEFKLSHEMGDLDPKKYLSYNSSHKKFESLYQNVINQKNIKLSHEWIFPSLYFITVSKKFKDIEKNDDKIIKFIGEEIRSDKLYNICKKGNMFTVEKLIYIGRTANIISRFKNGHKVTQALSNSIYDGIQKRVYIAEIDIFNIFDLKKTTGGIKGFDDKYPEFMPIELINNEILIKDIQIFLERYFIAHYQVPIFNIRDKTPKVNFEKWPMVSKPNIITIKDVVNSCFFEDVKYESKFSIEELLEEPRKKYENSKKKIKEKEKQFKEHM
ncbi:hypothetical protein CN606_17715 [Bacillus toyonensis]|uniref:hypothetical protein n=1 Tax=Bacillus toyonensis TaxID=155322 RepID=UPI000BF2158B|nr:hypothetical protein [Bacillus toyonensis]PEL01332.1 hypothetical protein CN606_17715 [Bacillus toyonensis]